MKDYNSINFKNKDIDKLDSNGPGKEKRQVVTEGALLNKWRPTNVDEKKGPEGKSSPKDLVKAGLFKEKDGDLYPTAKYDMLKKAGGLSKYGIK